MINLMPQFATVEEQFWFALGVSSLAFTLGAILREFFRDREIRIAGRCLVIASFFAFSCYSYHATMTCQRVLAEVQNASEVFVVADKTDYSLSTPNGTQIQWSTSGGRRTPMSITPGCGSVDDDTDRRTVGAIGRSDGPAVSVRNGTHGKSVMDAGKGF